MGSYGHTYNFLILKLNFMKKLNLMQMENLQGGKFRWSCALNSAAIGFSIASGQWYLTAAAGAMFFENECHKD